MEAYHITDQDQISYNETCDVIHEIQMKAVETIDSFIFEVILPYCSEVEHLVITKEDLTKALKLLREQEQKE